MPATQTAENPTNTPASLIASDRVEGTPVYRAGGKRVGTVKRLMLDHAFSFVDTVIFWVGESNWRSQGAMTKIGGIKRDGRFTREASGAMPYFIFEITKRRYDQGGRALVM